MAKRQATCTSCGFIDDASYVHANLGDCPACGESCQCKTKKQERFNTIRCDGIIVLEAG